MDKLVARLNIEHIRQLLASEKQPERRELLLRLLADEEARLAALPKTPEVKPG